MNRRAPSLLLVGLMLAGCSMFGRSQDAAGGPVVIPLPGVDGAAGPERNLNAYYHSVFEQLKGAYRARDLDTLRHLLAQHQRDDLPDHIEQLLGQFEVLAGGVWFEQKLAADSRMLVVEPARPLTEAQTFRFVVPGNSDEPVVELGGGGDLACLFLCTLTVKEHGVFGERRERRTSKVLRVERLHRLAKGAPLALQFAVPASIGNVVVREAKLMIELLTGQVRVGDRLTPIRRTKCCTVSSMAYPPNHGSIQRAPLKTLREALRRGSPKYFRHILLAAMKMPKEHKDEAMAALVRKLRVGTGDQARVAMVSLRALSGEDLPVTDRQKWLRWWEIYKPKIKAKAAQPEADKR
jgi:hypothetical protein